MFQGFRALGFKIRWVLGLKTGFRVWGVVFGVWGLGFRVAKSSKDPNRR